MFSYFNPLMASDKEMEEIATLSNIIKAEEFPHDNPWPLKYYKNLYCMPSLMHNYQLWILKRKIKGQDKDTLIALAALNFHKKEDNKKLFFFELSVHPDFRRQGIATAFLPILKASALENSRNLATTKSVGVNSPASLFLKKIGAKLGIANQYCELKIEKDLKIPEKKAPTENYECHFFQSSYPEELLLKFCKVKEVMNTVPLDDYQCETLHFTPEVLRELDKANLEKNLLRLTVYAQEKKTQEMVAYTQIFIEENDPTIAWQGDTGVIEAHRGHKIGFWMKTLMLNYLIEHYPQIKIVRSTNALSNAPMKKINNEMGFVKSSEISFWQLSIH